MIDKAGYISSIFSESVDKEFDRLSLAAFRYQHDNNVIYRNYCDHLKINPEHIDSIHKIPFIPIELFKSHKIVSESYKEKIVFTSSATTGNIPSRHYVADLNVYEKSFIKGFGKFYGDPQEYCILGLLPSYLERSGSSLVFMVNELINLSKNELSGFFLNDFDSLYSTISKLENNNSKYIIIGVSFALLDFGEKYHLNIKNGIVMETGGMKGRRKELIREELHSELKKIFNVKEIHSEYGMTELLSQAYSKGAGIFNCSPWMKVMVREFEDPLVVKSYGNGGINVIDLANINSCCFIATSDLGNIYKDGSFSVSGRFDSSDVRGCNLMYF